MLTRKLSGLLAATILVTAVAQANAPTPQHSEEVFPQTESEPIRPSESERTRAKSCRDECTSEGFGPEECDLECNWVC